MRKKNLVLELTIPLDDVFATVKADVLLKLCINLIETVLGTSQVVGSHYTEFVEEDDA